MCLDADVLCATWKVPFAICFCLIVALEIQRQKVGSDGAMRSAGQLHRLGRLPPLRTGTLAQEFCLEHFRWEPQI